MHESPSHRPRNTTLQISVWGLVLVNTQIAQNATCTPALFFPGTHVPNALVDDRYGISAYQHPEIVEMMEQTTPELRLLGFIDNEVFHNPSTPLNYARLEPWEGSSTTLETRLVNPPSKIIHEARTKNSCGTYLGRLEESENEHVAGRVRSHKRNGQMIWTIEPPRDQVPAPEAEDDTTPGAEPIPRLLSA
jgi:hypothetical protein